MPTELTDADRAYTLLLHGRAARAITEEWNTSTRRMSDTVADVPQRVMGAWLRHTSTVVALREQLGYALAPRSKPEPRRK